MNIKVKTKNLFNLIILFLYINKKSYLYIKPKLIYKQDFNQHTIRMKSSLIHL
ncbi:Hypothetical protein SFBmNL_00486 [Candidatus Arthromitus sp. SFB-mouse-NL]|nr:Hypothetical protein SFBmNL_00486 [Candidatus Arthromitus sp. SFB-mouse-NL]EGX29098.1 hypothetical protein SFBNYU_011350 [Candidatus Arthromitus sp. SFB-mouse-NYU]